MTITADNVHEYQLHTFSAEASELGWAPGHWPLSIDTDLGNGCPFLLIGRDEYVARYRQSNGCITLDVFND